MIDPSTFLAGGFVVGLVAAFWTKLKGLVARLMSYAIVTITIEDVPANAVTRYCRTNFTKSPYGARRFIGSVTYVRPQQRRLAVAFETLGLDATLFWNRWRPISLRRKSQDRNMYTLGNAVPLEVTFVRGTFDADALIGAALDAYNIDRHGLAVHADNATLTPPPDRRYRVTRLGGSRRGPTYDASQPQEAPAARTDHSDLDNGPGRRPLQWTEAELGEPIPAAADPLEYMALIPAQVQLTLDIERWLASKVWFEERRVPWRMGVLLAGPPGTGKSSYVRAVCQKLDLPVYMFDLATFDNDSFVTAWDRMLQATPCAAVIEDVDAVFKGRENVSPGVAAGLSFDCLLNRISGVAESSGVLLFVTTNHPETLDPALGRVTTATGSTRPGRIDRVIEFGPLTLEGRRHVAERILAGYPAEAAACVQQGTDDTGAVFEDRCVRAALKCYWDDRSAHPPA